MAISYKPIFGVGASVLGDAQVPDQTLTDADLTQPGAVQRGAGAVELPLRAHQAGGTEAALDPALAEAIFYRDEELCLVHDGFLYGWRPTETTGSGRQAWKLSGPWPGWQLRQTFLHQPNDFLSAFDVASITAQGRVFYVATWKQDGGAVFGRTQTAGIYAIAVDQDGGVVAPAALLATGTNKVNPRACACDTGVVIAWADSTPGSYEASAWRLSNPVEFAATVAIATVAAGNSNLHDMRKDGTSDQVIFVLADSVPATFTVGIRRITVALVVTSLGNIGAVAQAPSVGVSVDVDPLGGYLITWASATNANAVHVTNVGVVDTVIATVATANPIVRITGCHVDGVASTGTVGVEQRVGATPDYRDHVQTFNYNGAALASVRTQRGASIYGHAAVADGRPLAALGNWSPVNLGTLMLSDLLTGDVHGRALPLELGDDTGAILLPPSTPQILGDTLLYGAVRSNVPSPAPIFQETPSLMVLGFTRMRGARQPASAFSMSLDALGGFPWKYDGSYPCEADWHVLPDIVSVAASTTVQGVMGLGTYIVGVTFRHFDRRQQLWRAAVAVRTITLTGIQDTIDIVTVNNRWTARSDVVVEFWRSLANQGFPLYLENQRFSDTGQDNLSFSYTSTDVSAAAQMQLDQFPPAAVLPHETAQVTDFAVFASGRFWSPDPEDASVLRHTIDHDVSRLGFGFGYEGTQFVVLDTPVRPQAGGDLEGVFATLTGFECHLVTGLGPDKRGTGAFEPPYKFAIQDAATSQARTARISESGTGIGGLAYATDRGVFVLQRDRVSRELSTAVSRFYRVDGVVPSALAYLPESSELMVATNSADARTVRYHVPSGRWVIDSFRRALDLAVSPAGQVAWLLPDGRVRVLDDSAIADGSQQLVFGGETPTLRPDAGTVSTPYTLQRIFLHTYLISGPAQLDVAIVDARTGEVIALNRQTYTSVGPESRDAGPVNRSTYGHRVRYSQPAGDTGRIVVVEIDSQIAISDKVTARTVTSL